MTNEIIDDYVAKGPLFSLFSKKKSYNVWVMHDFHEHQKALRGKGESLTKESQLS